MGYAVELYFDAETEESVWKIRRSLIAAGITATVSELGDRPHVSLAVFSNLNPDDLIQVTQNFVPKLETFEFQFSAIGAFPSDENVIFLAPAPSRHLLDLHQDFHQRLTNANLASTPYYLPRNWMPHCTVEMNLPEDEIAKAFKICKKNFSEFSGNILQIGVVEFRPIKELAVWPIK